MKIYTRVILASLVVISMFTGGILTLNHIQPREQVVIKTIPNRTPRPSIEDIIAFAMVARKEVPENAPDEVWQKIALTAKNRADTTGRPLHNVLTSKGCVDKTGKCWAMFSPVNDPNFGTRIDQHNIKDVAALLRKAERVLSMTPVQWSATHFYSTNLASPPKWAADYVELGTADGHVFLYDNGEAAYRFAHPVSAKEQRMRTIKPRWKKQKVVSHWEGLRKILRKMT